MACITQSSKEKPVSKTSRIVYPLEDQNDRTICAKEGRTSMRREDLIAFISQNAEGSLDEVVHDVYSRQASGINNQGPASQIDFLIEAGFSLEEIESLVRETLG